MKLRAFLIFLNTICYIKELILIKIKKLSDAMFWMLFSLACVCIILYMAFDFRNAVESTVRTMERNQCVEVCNEMITGKLDYDFNISIPMTTVK